MADDGASLKELDSIVQREFPGFYNHLLDVWGTVSILVNDYSNVEGRSCYCLQVEDKQLGSVVIVHDEAGQKVEKIARVRPDIAGIISSEKIIALQYSVAKDTRNDKFPEIPFP